MNEDQQNETVGALEEKQQKENEYREVKTRILAIFSGYLLEISDKSDDPALRSQLEALKLGEDLWGIPAGGMIQYIISQLNKLRSDENKATIDYIITSLPEDEKQTT